MSCGCDDNSNIKTIGDEFLKQLKGFEFVDGVQTKVNVDELSSGLKRVSFDYFPYDPPTVSFSVSPSFVEVGDVIPSATYTLNVSKQSNDIDSINVTPDPGVTFLEGVNTFFQTNLTGSSNGKIGEFTATITDDSGNGSVVSSTSVSNLFRYYQGYSEKSSLTESEIKALENNQLSTGIKTIYGGSKSYTLPVSAINRFIYWCFPSNTSPFVSLTSGGFDVPFVSVGNVSITNDFNITTLYTVVRTSAAFGSTALTIEMS